MSSKRNVDDGPSGDVKDNSYVSRQGAKNESVPVVSDNDLIDEGGDSRTADTDAQLERDDADAIDESNIIDERTRHAEPRQGYREPGDDEGLPQDDGTSSN